MARNIFAAEYLILDYSEKERVFVLKKNDNPSGRKYDARGAYNLIINIIQEMSKTKHEMEYRLLKYLTTANAEKALAEYKRTIKDKEKSNPSLRSLETRLLDD